MLSLFKGIFKFYLFFYKTNDNIFFFIIKIKETKTTSTSFLKQARIEVPTPTNKGWKMYISARYPTSSHLLNNEDLIFFQSIYIVTKTNYTCKIYLCNICQHYIYLFCNFIVRFCLILNLFLYSLSSLCTIMFYFSPQIKQLELQNCFYVLVYIISRFVP